MVRRDRRDNRVTAQWRKDSPQKVRVLAVNYDVLTNQQNTGLTGLFMPHSYGTVYNVHVGDWYDTAVDRLKIGDTKILDLPIVRTPGSATVGIAHHLMGAVFRRPKRGHH
jgi:hypothetical protein